MLSFRQSIALLLSPIAFILFIIISTALAVIGFFICLRISTKPLKASSRSLSSGKYTGAHAPLFFLGALAPFSFFSLTFTSSLTSTSTFTSTSTSSLTSTSTAFFAFVCFSEKPFAFFAFSKEPFAFSVLSSEPFAFGLPPAFPASLRFSIVFSYFSESLSSCFLINENAINVIPSS